MLCLLLQAVSNPTCLASFSLHSLLRNQPLLAVSTPICCVYSYKLSLCLLAWPPSVYTVYPGTSFYLLSLLLPAVSTPTCLASLSLHSLPRNQLLPAVSIPTCCVYSYLPDLPQSTTSTQEPASTCCVYSYGRGLLLQAVSNPTCLASFSLHSLLRNQPLLAVSTPTCCVFSYRLSLCLPAWPPSVYPGTSFYLLSLLLPAVSTPTCLASLSLHSLPKNQFLPAVSTPICLASLSLHNLFRIKLDILPPVHCPAHPLSEMTLN